MAPPRQGTSGKRATAAPKASAAASAKTKSQAFVCPECGRTFGRAAALGAHRKRAHNVAGQSAQARRSRTARQSSRAAAAGRRGRPASASTASRQRSQQADGNTSVDRDALLKAVFPAGMPARHDVIAAASGWLDDAERLARMR